MYVSRDGTKPDMACCSAVEQVVGQVFFVAELSNGHLAFNECGAHEADFHLGLGGYVVVDYAVNEALVGNLCLAFCHGLLIEHGDVNGLSAEVVLVHQSVLV